MPPQKAIIIVLILFFILAIAIAVLYVNNQPAMAPGNQPADNGYDNTQASSTSQEKLSPEQQKVKDIEIKTSQQIEQIVEQGKAANGGVTAEAQRKIEDAVNQEIMEKTKLKTPEQLKADQARQAELDKIEQEVNQRIKNQLPSR